MRKYARVSNFWRILASQFFTRSGVTLGRFAKNLLPQNLLHNLDSTSTMLCFSPQFRLILKSLFVPAHILIVLLCTCLRLSAQTAGNTEQDSLKSFYKQLQSYEQQGKYDLYRGEICNKIASYYLKQYNVPSRDSAKKYSHLALSVAKTFANNDLERQAYLNLALSFAKQDSLAEAITFTNTALAIARNDKRKERYRHIAFIQLRLGNYYYELGDMENSLKAHFDAVKQMEQIPFENETSRSNSNLGVLLSDLKRFDEAEAYLRKGLFIAEKIRQMKLSSVTSLLFSTHFISTKQFDSAWKYAALCREYAIKVPDDEMNINGLINMAIIRQEQGKTTDAIAVAREMMRLAVETGMENILDEGNLILAKAYFAQSDFKQAYTIAEKILAGFLVDDGEGNNVPEKTAELHKLLADIYKQDGNFQKAFYHFERQATIRDSILSATKQKQLNALISFTEAKKKEQQLTELRFTTEVQSLQLQQRNFALVGVSIGGALVVVLGVLLFRQRRLQAQQRIAETEQRLLRTRLNPHLWFNALSSVQDHLLSRANPRATATYLSKIASVMRQSLESSYQDTVSISEEVEFAEKYLTIQQMRLEQAFDYSVEIHEAIDPDSVRVPSMLLEPFLENTIEHGFQGSLKSEKKEKSHIIIRIEPLEQANKRSAALLAIHIEDNGTGLTKADSPPNSEKSEHRSRAVEITKERLRLLAPSSRKSDVGVWIEDRTGGGVAVKIVLPLLGN